MTDNIGALIVDLDGDLELTESDRARLVHPGCAGVILFSRNYHDRNQLHVLTNAIKQLRVPELFICVDQEGGRVQRFREGFTRLPPAAAFGTMYDEDQEEAVSAAHHCGAVMVEELRECGIDFSFAPVLDVTQAHSEVIGDRAFHYDPMIVAELAGAFIDGMRKAGMPAVGKHFPGHGGVAEDSHQCLPCDHRTLDALRKCDLVPYRKLLDRLSGVMTAHVHYDAINERVPAYSSYWLHAVLRGELGFTGAIFSDDLSMQGAVTEQTITERAEQALNAGCDYLILCKDRMAVDDVLEGCAALTDRNAYRDSFYASLA